MTALTDSLRADLNRARRGVDQLVGRRVGLISRDEELVREVGLAKGRLAIKPKVERFLESLQSDAHQKNVGAYERMLTALVQQVLPGEHPIGLDLYTERGLPALDVFVDRQNGVREDVLDDQGGAMTNVVSMGLRLIAAVKSRKRRFLVLDEADCWIAPPRVPSFYKVLKDAATKMNVQCLVVSHHEVAEFDDGISIARISGDPGKGVSIESAPDTRAWADDAPGIRYIRLQNVQAYADETLRLSPGINAVTGPNNLGKSVFVRALRAVFYGESRDSLVRHFQKQAVVEIGIEEGYVLQWSRQPKRNPVNMWRLLDPEGNVVTHDGMTYETGGRTVPDWVAEVTGIAKVEDLDIHVGHQKFPVFLLGQAAPQRAAVLSVGQEASYIREMIALYKERCTRDAATVRNGEQELTSIRAKLARLERVEHLTERLDGATKILDEIERLDGECRGSESAAGQIEKAQGRLDAHRRLAAVFGRLPERDDLDRLVKCLTDNGALEDTALRIERAHADGRKATRLAAAFENLPDEFMEIVRHDELIRVGKRLRDSQLALSHDMRLQAAFGKLPIAFPEIASSAQAEDAAAAIEATAAEHRKAIDEGKKIEGETKQVVSEIETLLKESGGACPACGTALDDPSRLLTHAHHGAEADHG